MRLKPPMAVKYQRHHLFTVGAVRYAAHVRVPRGVEPYRAAVRQGDRRVGEVGVGEDAEHVAGAAGHWQRVGEQLLLAVGQRVCRATAHVVEAHPVRLQPRFGGHELVDGRLAGLEDLGIDVQRGGAERRGHLHHLLALALVLADPRVLIGEQARLRVPRAAQFLAQGVHPIERVGERRRRRRQLALEGAERRDVSRQLVLGGAPCRLVRVDVGEISALYVSGIFARSRPARPR